MIKVSVIVGLLAMGGVFAQESSADRAAWQGELEKLKKDLKPLREKAYLEDGVIEARKKLDEAYREYWKAVRSAMAELEPAKKALLEREQELRTLLNPPGGSSGSRAEDYEKKAKE